MVPADAGLGRRLLRIAVLFRSQRGTGALENILRSPMDTPKDCSPTRPKERTARWRLPFNVGVVILLFFVIARLSAPFVIRNAINHRLNRIPNYKGDVGSIGLHLWRGGYRIGEIQIVKSNGKVSEPFFSADRIDFSIAWHELLRGRLFSAISIRNGRLNFLRGPSEETSQLNADKRWQDAINDLFPIDITNLEIRGGTLRFVDTTHTPRVDVSIHDLAIHATGLQNRPTANADPYPAKIDISGVTIGGGRLHLYVRMEPLAATPHFELAAELKNVSMPALNDFLRAYANVEVAQGQFEVFSQMAMRNGHYDGYIKPFIDDLEFKALSDEDKLLGHRLWNSIVAGFANLAKNKETKQVATRIPFSGEANSLDVHTWKTVENGLHNGFVRALSHTFEGTPDPDHVDPKGASAIGTPSAPKS
jgi:Domain of Unknown Function (DUF748)